MSLSSSHHPSLYQINKFGYYSSEPKSENKPILSFLVCCRFCKENNILYKFLDSVERVFNTPEQRKQIEILIKFDIDDEKAIREILEKELLKKYPLIIRPYFYRRWEGRLTLNLQYMFLFSRKAKTSKYIVFATDDCVVEGNFLPIIEKHLNQPYCIFTRHSHKKEKLEAAREYKKPKEEGGYLWSGAGLTEPFPIVSDRIIECCGNMGWQVNIDNWLSLLNVIMYTKYKVNLMIDLLIPHIGFNPNPIGKQPEYFVGHFNMEMFVSGTKTCENDYYFDLTERQAKNIYLNMKEEGYIR